MTQFVDDSGNYLDYAGSDFAITKQCAIFSSFKIKGDVSLTFTLPNNSVNRKALNYSGLNQNSGAALSRKRFTVIRNGNILCRGFIIITGDKGKDIECFFISGNSNWLRKFDFKCNEIVNNDFLVQWNSTQIFARRTATEGIIFPVIDFCFNRNKFDRYFLSTRWGGSELEPDELVTELYPCLYVHTLVNELSKHANVKISGTLLQDKLYKTLIITPEGPELVNPTTGLKVNQENAHQANGGDHIPIGAIAPTFKAIEVIKWLIFSFGCVAYFDEYSQTLTLNLLDKFEKEDADDWSQYLVSAEIEHDKVSQHNYIRAEESPEEEIQEYNKSNAVSWGEIDIQSGRDDESENDVYVSPFLIPRDAIGDAPLQWATPYVEFVKLEDDKAIPYTSVSDLGGKARFNVASGLSLESADKAVFRVVDDSGIYTGIHLPNIIGSPTDVRFDSYADFISTSTGTLFKQRVTKVSAGHRVLVCIPNLDVKQFTMYTNLNYRTVGDDTRAAYAYASKPRYPYSTLLGHKQGLHYGEVSQTGYNDITLTESHLNKFKKMVINPPVLGRFILPEAVFQKWKFNKFIYLKTEKLSGYFVVQKIDQYVGGSVEVEIELMYAD